MELTLNSTISGRERQKMLQQWFRERFGSMEAAGRQMGLTGKSLKDLCLKDRVPTFRYEQFRTLDVPADLLPEHGYNKPGPRPREKETEGAEAGAGAS
jgi:hypothetical protein